MARNRQFRKVNRNTRNGKRTGWTRSSHLHSRDRQAEIANEKVREDRNSPYTSVRAADELPEADYYGE